MGEPRRRYAGRPSCDCVIEADLDQRGLNTRVSTELFSGAVVIATDKADSSVRRKPVAAIASYCPFCGKAYAAHEDEAVDETADESADKNAEASHA